MNLTRRKLFAGIATLIAAPTIVRVASIMPVRSVPSADILALLMARIKAAEDRMVAHLSKQIWAGDSQPLGLGEMLRQFPEAKPRVWPEPRTTIARNFDYKQFSAIVRAA